MPTPKAAIKEILEGFDHKNDALWTEDGSPLLSEIQKLANDPKINRAQINDALPGFVRKTNESVSEDEQPDTETAQGDETGGIDGEAAKNTTIAAPPVEEDEELSPEQDAQRVRALAHQRVINAEIDLNKAKEAVSEAQRVVVTMEQRHARALSVYSAKYPPMSPEEAIKVHLRRQQEIQRERVTGSKLERASVYCPADATLMDRKRNNGHKGLPPKTFLPRRAAVSY